MSIYNPIIWVPVLTQFLFCSDPSPILRTPPPLPSPTFYEVQIQFLAPHADFVSGASFPPFYEIQTLLMQRLTVVFPGPTTILRSPQTDFCFNPPPPPSPPQFYEVQTPLICFPSSNSPAWDALMEPLTLAFPGPTLLGSPPAATVFSFRHAEAWRRPRSTWSRPRPP